MFWRDVQNETDAHRKIRLRVEDVQGRNCLTNFWVRVPESLGPIAKSENSEKWDFEEWILLNCVTLGA